MVVCTEGTKLAKLGPGKIPASPWVPGIAVPPLTTTLVADYLEVFLDTLLPILAVPKLVKLADLHHGIFLLPITRSFDSQLSAESLKA